MNYNTNIMFIINQSIVFILYVKLIMKINYKLNFVSI